MALKPGETKSAREGVARSTVLPLTPGRLMSYDEFVSLPEQPGLQLVDGIMVHEPSPGFTHQDSVGLLYRRMADFAEADGLGRVMVAPLDVVLADNQVLQPDVMFVTSERLSIIREAGLFGIPDLVVEVLSPSTRRYDLGRKRKIYHDYGLRELWMVDLEKAVIDRHDSGKNDWEVTRFERRSTLASRALPGFRLDLRELFGRESPA